MLGLRRRVVLELSVPSSASIAAINPFTFRFPLAFQLLQFCLFQHRSAVFRRRDIDPHLVQSGVEEVRLDRLLQDRKRWLWTWCSTKGYRQERPPRRSVEFERVFEHGYTG